MSGNILGHEDTEITLLTIRFFQPASQLAFRTIFSAYFGHNITLLLLFMPSGVFFKLKIGFSVLAPNSNFVEFRTKFREIPPIVSGPARIANSDPAYLMLQTFLYNLQQPVCRYLVTRLNTKSLPFLVF